MKLKTAAAACLIALCSAAIAVLIVRRLDSRRAESVKSELAEMKKELQALHQLGSLPAAQNRSAADKTAGTELVVYSFRGKDQNPAYQAIESRTRAVLTAHFAAEMKSGTIVWRELDLQKPNAAELKKQFDVQIPVIVLARMKDEKVEKWERLDRVWTLVADHPGFDEYVQKRIAEMLNPAAKPEKSPPNGPVFQDILGKPAT